MSYIYDVSGVCGHQERETFRLRFSVVNVLNPYDFTNLQNSVFNLLQSFSHVRFINNRSDLSSACGELPLKGYLTSIDFINVVTDGVADNVGNQAYRPLTGGHSAVAERCFSFLDGIIPIYSDPGAEYAEDDFLAKWNQNFRGVFNADYSEHIGESWPQFPDPPFSKYSCFSVVTQFLNS